MRQLTICTGVPPDSLATQLAIYDTTTGTKCQKRIFIRQSHKRRHTFTPFTVCVTVVATPKLENIS